MINYVHNFLVDENNIVGNFDNDLVVRKHVYCTDGFSMSVQASKEHCCMPKKTLFNGKYSHVEIGFPSEHEPLLMDFADFDTTKKKIPKDREIYVYVPVAVVNRIIENHGGIQDEQ